MYRIIEKCKALQNHIYLSFSFHTIDVHSNLSELFGICRSLADQMEDCLKTIRWLFACDMFITCSTIHVHSLSMYVYVSESRCVPWHPWNPMESLSDRDTHQEGVDPWPHGCHGSGCAVLLWWWASILMRRVCADRLD